MPVTAKLSRKFYERFGEDLTNELVDWFNSVDTTYRSDLKELLELQYARFEARLEQRLAEVKSDLVKWMFAFWAPTALAVLALLLRK
ncbi:MAG TPA: hypothetical protein VKQ05_03235 [Gemmatimonadales bacterium]|nr:hypothetical protein [Gemmatimonadales bacterium]